MPRYDFRCTECGKEFTATVPWAQKGEVRCPDCGAPTELRISSFAIGGVKASRGGGTNSPGSCFT